jgi:hypothetical protein
MSSKRNGAMNDRARAIAILKQARDILAKRLTERVLDSREEILEDAEGLTYCGEIDSIYEQLAVRLNHISAMLSSLPPVEDERVAPPPKSTARGLEYKPRPGVFQADTSLPATVGASDAAGTISTAEPPSGRYLAEAVPSPVTFESFGRQIVAGEVEAAGRSLAVLFAVGEESGLRCAATFYQRLCESPETLTKAMRLHHELQSGSMHNSLRLLWECFGLDGLESIAVMRTLQARLSGHNEAA